MLNFKKEIAKVLAPLAGMSPAETESYLEIPPEPEMGEYAFPCFVLARRFKQSPKDISAALARQIKPGGLLEKTISSGPYLNFYVRRPALAAGVLSAALEKGENYGFLSDGEGQTVLIDYSAPNIAKPFSVGHLRSTVIGNALYRLYKSLGYRVVGINHLGDWGTQFGKLIVAFQRWGEQALLEKEPVQYLFQLYVRFHKEAEANPELDEEARLKFRELEKGDPEALEIWQRFRKLSLDEFQRLYNFMGISFDSYLGESFYNDMLEETIRLAREKGLAKESEGALVADLEPYGLPSCLLQKKDGAALYITRDLTAAIYRYEKYRFSKLFYVVGSEQTLHFKQMFKILELMGFPWAKNCVHVPFGLIRFKDGRMSTREGNVIFLEDVLDRSIKLAHSIIQEKNPDLEDKESAARAVGLGAVIFGDLLNDRIKDVEFDWDSVLDFSGETAPYVQYAHARICSILRRAGTDFTGNFSPGKTAFSFLPLAKNLTAPEEEQLIITISRFSEQIKRAAEELKPSILAHYLIVLAREFNKFYHACPVLTAEGNSKTARLLLIQGVRTVLSNGLSLLGISAPEEM